MIVLWGSAEERREVKRFLNVKQLSELLAIAPTTIYQWVREERIPYHRLGRLVRFAEDDIDSWLRKRQQNPRGRGTEDLID
ncbi:MAG: hypothetical protein AMS16_00450 [Planctomycetes bacterium DG_58]|nr:MAG: hypothetical protein AMS16_00450 [Planctomycetes bacterium DG_58]